MSKYKWLLYERSVPVIKKMVLVLMMISVCVYSQSDADSGRPEENLSIGQEEEKKLVQDTSQNSSEKNIVKEIDTSEAMEKDTSEVKKEDTSVLNGGIDTNRKVTDASEKKNRRRKAKSKTGVNISNVAGVVDNSGAATAVEIPGGVLFGSFAKEDGPFLFMGNVIVPSGQTLEFGPGCKIYIGGKYSTITVFGKIKVKGTAAEPVIFQSAKENPNPWDWDRIYCRSRNRSEFEHCIIRHSNYGIFVENGSLLLKHCTFERNSLHGLVVRNSDVHIINSVFQKGHVLALFCQEGASVQADSIIVKNNITGIACDAKSFLNMEKGVLKGNRNGLAVRIGSSVSLVATDVTKNGNGIVSEVEIPRSMREMIFDNTIDMKSVDTLEMVKILKPPQGVKSVALPKVKTKIKTSSSFKPGFAALRAPREQTASLIGNVTLGTKYYYPKSFVHPFDLDTNKNKLIINSQTGDTTYPVCKPVYHQTKYVGEHGDAAYTGIQPELLFFAQGKRGKMDVSLNADLYTNTWLMGVGDTGFVSDTLDVRPLGVNLLTMGVNYGDQQLILGDFYENISETSISGRKIRGLKYTGSFLNMGRGTKRIAFHLAFGQSEERKTLGEHRETNYAKPDSSSQRQQITYVADLSAKPTHNVTISVRGIISHDQTNNPMFTSVITDTALATPISAQTGGVDANIVLLNGKMEINAELNVGAHDTIKGEDQNDIAWHKPQITKAIPNVFKSIDADHVAFVGNVTGIVKGIDLASDFLYVAKDYFSAGSPYFESDRIKASVSGEKQISDRFNVEGGYEFERTSLSNVLKDISKLNDGNQIGESETPTNNNTIDLVSEYSFGNNKPAIKGDYKLKFQSKDEIQSYDSVEVTINAMLDYFRNDHTLGLELKQRFKNGINYSVKYRMVRKNSESKCEDNTSIENLYKDEDDAWENKVTGRLGFKIKRRIRNKTTVSVKFKSKLEDSSDEMDYKITDNLRINIIPRKLTLTLNGEYRNKVKNTPLEIPVKLYVKQKTVKGELKYAVTSKLSSTLMGKYENYLDENSSSSENYSVIIGGLHFTYLF